MHCYSTFAAQASRGLIHLHACGRQMQNCIRLLMILYKYRQNSSYTDQIFIEGKVWLAKSSSLNDPCECTLHSLAPEWVAEKVKTIKSAQMAGFLMVFPELRRTAPPLNSAPNCVKSKTSKKNIRRSAAGSKRASPHDCQIRSLYSSSWKIN